MASAAVMVYGLDAYRDSSNEIFIMNMFFKNFMYYGLANYSNNWAAAAGAGQVMSVFAGTGFAFVQHPSRTFANLSVPLGSQCIYMASDLERSGPNTTF